jgi:hypothetical protein
MLREVKLCQWPSESHVPKNRVSSSREISPSLLNVENRTASHPWRLKPSTALISRSDLTSVCSTGYNQHVFPLCEIWGSHHSNYGGTKHPLLIRGGTTLPIRGGTTLPMPLEVRKFPALLTCSASVAQPNAHACSLLPCSTVMLSDKWYRQTTKLGHMFFVTSK